MEGRRSGRNQSLIEMTRYLLVWLLICSLAASGCSSPSPAVPDESSARSRTVTLHALHLGDGSPAWQVEVDTGPVSPLYLMTSPVAVAPDVLAFRAGEFLLGLDPKNGKQLWSFPVGKDFIRCAPVSVDRTVFLATRSRILEVDSKSGSGRGQIEAPVHAGVCQAGGRLFYSTVAEVVALDPSSKKELWRRALPGLANVAEVPAADGRHVYVASGDEVVCLDAATGAVQWKFDCASAASPPAIDATTIYVAGADSVLHALDAESGRERWSRKDALAITPVAGHGRVFALSKAFSSEGRLLWKDQTLVDVASLDASTIAYVDVRRLVVVDAASGRKKWDRTFEGRPSHASAVHGLLFVAEQTEP